MQVDLPGNDRRRLSPGAGTVPVIAGHGHYVGHVSAQFFLFLIKIVPELGVEGVGIHVIAGGAAEDLGVSGPPHALVPLGAVRGGIEEIPF